MKKQLFRWVSRGSSNTIASYRGIVKKMKQDTLLALTVIMIASMMIGTAWAQPSVELSPSVIKPGEKVTILGQTSPGATVFIEISNSRTSLDSLNVTANTSGQFSLEYRVAANSPIDVYIVRVQVGEESTEISFILSKMTPQQLADSIRVLVVNAKKQAETALMQVRKQGQPIPIEIRDKYMQGLNDIENAANAIQSQNYVAAQGSLQEALNKFREVVEYSYGDNVEPVTNPEQERIRVQEKIDTLHRQYSEIKGAVDKLGENGLNVETLERDLNTLRERITEAQSILDEGDVSEAEQIVIRAQQLVAQRLTALRQRQAEVTKRLAVSYQTSLENRVMAYRDTFQKLQAVRPAQSVMALQELETLRQQLTVSNSLIENDNLVTALQEMRNTETRLKNLANTVNGEVTSRLLNRIDELTANLQNLSASDLSKIQTEIEETKNTLNDYLRKHPSSRPNNQGAGSQRLEDKSQ